MTKTFFDSLPQVLSDNNDGSITYRWNIEQVDEESWSSNEVIVWRPISRRKITKAVIASIWDVDVEQKLINDFNATSLGLFSEDENDNDYAIYAYMSFLTERKNIKEMIKNDCKLLDIKEE